MNHHPARKRILKRVGLGLCGAAALAAAFLGGRAFAAGIPEADVLNYAGTLLALDGTPVEGSHDIQIEFSTSASGVPALCSTLAENTAVTLGRFSVPLDGSCVEDVRQNPNLYVRVSVDGENFGWSKVGAVPYAVEAGHANEAERAVVAERAEEASGVLDERIVSLEEAIARGSAVPAHAVMAFALDECPPGWTPLEGARGRTIVGVPAGGTVQGAVGAALADLEDRAHSHTVNPAAAVSSPAGAHAHSVDPESALTEATDLAHTHAVNPAAFSVSHRHIWSSYNWNFDKWLTYNAQGNQIEVIDYQSGIGGSGTLYPFAYSGLSVDFYTSTETVMIDVPETTSGDASVSLNHDHVYDLPATDTTSAGDHTHEIDLAATTSSNASTASVIPYLQLLYCRKL